METAYNVTRPLFLVLMVQFIMQKWLGYKNRIIFNIANSQSKYGHLVESLSTEGSRKSRPISNKTVTVINI